MMQLAFEVILRLMVNWNWFSMYTVLLWHYIPQENKCEYISVIWNLHEDMNSQVYATQIILSSDITHTIISLQIYSVFESAGKPQHMKLVGSYIWASSSCHSLILQPKVLQCLLSGLIYVQQQSLLFGSHNWMPPASFNVYLQQRLDYEGYLL